MTLIDHVVPQYAPPAGNVRPPMSRLIRVELRKARDTRAGLWLLITIAVVTVAIEVIMAFTAKDSDRTFDGFFGVALLVQAIILPVLGILLVTSEWSQRTGLVTFSLEPVRSRIIVAKLSAAVLLGAGALAVAFAAGALANAAGGQGHSWDLTVGGFGDFGLLQLINIVQGVAFGLLIMNSAAAIVAYFVVPTAWAILFGAWSALDSVKDWLDLNSAASALGDHTMSGAAWAHLAVAATIWIVIPLAVGSRRLLRAELK